MMGEYPDAERCTAVPSRSRHHQPRRRIPGDAETRSELARAQFGLGLLLKKTNRFPESESALSAGDPPP